MPDNNDKLIDANSNSTYSTVEKCQGDLTTNHTESIPEVDSAELIPEVDSEDKELEKVQEENEPLSIKKKRLEDIIQKISEKRLKDTIQQLDELEHIPSDAMSSSSDSTSISDFDSEPEEVPRVNESFQSEKQKFWEFLMEGRVNNETEYTPNTVSTSSSFQAPGSSNSEQGTENPIGNQQRSPVSLQTLQNNNMKSRRFSHPSKLLQILKSSTTQICDPVRLHNSSSNALHYGGSSNPGTSLPIPQNSTMQGMQGVCYPERPHTLHYGGSSNSDCSPCKQPRMNPPLVVDVKHDNQQRFPGSLPIPQNSTTQRMQEVCYPERPHTLHYGGSSNPGTSLPILKPHTLSHRIPNETAHIPNAASTSGSFQVPGSSNSAQGTENPIGNQRRFPGSLPIPQNSTTQRMQGVCYLVNPNTLYEGSLPYQQPRMPNSRSVVDITHNNQRRFPGSWPIPQNSTIPRRTEVYYLTRPPLQDRDSSNSDCSRKQPIMWNSRRVYPRQMSFLPHNDLDMQDAAAKNIRNFFLWERDRFDDFYRRIMSLMNITVLTDNDASIRSLMTIYATLFESTKRSFSRQADDFKMLGLEDLYNSFVSDYNKIDGVLKKHNNRREICDQLMKIYKPHDNLKLIYRLFSYIKYQIIHYETFYFKLMLSKHYVACQRALYSKYPVLFSDPSTKSLNYWDKIFELEEEIQYAVVNNINLIDFIYLDIFKSSATSPNDICTFLIHVIFGECNKQFLEKDSRAGNKIDFLDPNFTPASGSAWMFFVKMGKPNKFLDCSSYFRQLLTLSFNQYRKLVITKPKIIKSFIIPNGAMYLKKIFFLAVYDMRDEKGKSTILELLDSCGIIDYLQYYKVSETEALTMTCKNDNGVSQFKKSCIRHLQRGQDGSFLEREKEAGRRAIMEEYMLKNQEVMQDDQEQETQEENKDLTSTLKGKMQYLRLIIALFEYDINKQLCLPDNFEYDDNLILYKNFIDICIQAGGNPVSPAIYDDICKRSNGTHVSTSDTDTEEEPLSSLKKSCCSPVLPNFSKLEVD